MKITERRLRQIIRDTLLEEQNRIDEGQTLNAIKAAALAAGLILSGDQLAIFANYLAGGGNSGGVSDPLSGSPHGARGHFMTSAEEAKLNAFIKNPTLDEVPHMKELINRVNKSFGAGRQGTTRGGKSYRRLLGDVSDVIENLENNKKETNTDAMYSLDDI